MQRPAALSFPALRPAQRLQRLRGQLVSLRGRGPRPVLLLKIGGSVAGLLGLLAVLVVFTPVAHPRDLSVTGATGSRADAIRSALEEQAAGESTFVVSESKLMQAVQDYPEVAGVHVDRHPPFGLAVAVLMRPPVARLQVGTQSVILAGDGTVLRRAGVGSLPRIDASITGLRVAGARATGGRGALAVLAAAPDRLLPYARTIRAGASGLEVVLVRGPRLIFGNARQAADKWLAAATVIADGVPSATYIDLRVPSRPAVGGMGGSKVAGSDDAPPSLAPVSPAAAALAAETAQTLAAGRVASGRAPLAQDAPVSTTAGTGTIGTGGAANTDPSRVRIDDASAGPAGGGGTDRADGDNGSEATGTGNGPVANSTGGGASGAATGGGVGLGGVTP